MQLDKRLLSENYKFMLNAGQNKLKKAKWSEKKNN